jgi:hypothetical protein
MPIALADIHPQEDSLDRSVVEYFLAHPDKLFAGDQPIRIVPIRGTTPYAALDGNARLYVCYRQGMQYIPIEPEMDSQDVDAVEEGVREVRSRGVYTWKDLDNRILGIPPGEDRP